MSLGSSLVGSPVQLRRLARAVKTDIKTITGTAYADIDGLAVTFTPGLFPVRCRIVVPQVKSNSAIAGGTNTTVKLTDGSNVDQDLTGTTFLGTVANSRGNINVEEDFVSLVAGVALTWKVRAATNQASGSVNFEGTSATKIKLEVFEVVAVG